MTQLRSCRKVSVTGVKSPEWANRPEIRFKTQAGPFHGRLVRVWGFIHGAVGNL